MRSAKITIKPKKDHYKAGDFVSFTSALGCGGHYLDKDMTMDEVYKEIGELLEPEFDWVRKK